MHLLAGGYSNKEIARAVFLSEGTVKHYMSDILDKLGTRDRTRAVLKAITLRIIWCNYNGGTFRRAHACPPSPSP